jgi:hypothetical protein
MPGAYTLPNTGSCKSCVTGACAGPPYRLSLALLHRIRAAEAMVTKQTTPLPRAHASPTADESGQSLCKNEFTIKTTTINVHARPRAAPAHRSSTFAPSDPRYVDRRSRSSPKTCSSATRFRSRGSPPPPPRPTVSPNRALRPQVPLDLNLNDYRIKFESKAPSFAAPGGNNFAPDITGCVDGKWTVAPREPLPVLTGHVSSLPPY